jgi:hypothetical protein
MSSTYVRWALVSCLAVVGCKGSSGAEGPKGDPGINIVWRGPWSASTSYATNDAVQSQGAAYVAVAANLNSSPPSAAWELLVDRGERGIQGPQGIQGPMGPSGDAQIVSGTRLTAVRQVYVGEDGSRLARDGYQFYDNVLGSYCAPTKADDGEIRCLPGAPDTAGVQAGVFAEGTCTTPVAYYQYWSFAGCAPTYASDSGSLMCSGASFEVSNVRMYHLGRLLAAGTTLYSNTSGPCVATTSASAQTFYEVDAEIAATTFMRFMVPVQ